MLTLSVDPVKYVDKCHIPNLATLGVIKADVIIKGILVEAYVLFTAINSATQTYLIFVDKQPVGHISIQFETSVAKLFINDAPEGLEQPDRITVTIEEEQNGTFI